MKELGTHILVCEVSYNSSNAVSDKLSFRKFFKFQVLEEENIRLYRSGQVMKPLDVKTKFYNAESDEVFLEAQVNSSISKTFQRDRLL